MAENNPYSSDALGLPKDSSSIVNNPYSSEALGMPAAPALKQSMYVGVQKNPDEFAKVVNMADQMKVPSSLVESNPEAFRQSEILKSLNPSELNKSFPKMAAWMENPDNAGIAHDDIIPLKRMESAIDGYSFTSDLFNKLNSGIASLGKSVLQVPAAAGQALALPYNLAVGAQGEQTGRPDLYEPYKFQYSKDGIFLDNPLTQYFDRRSKEYSDLATERTVSNEELFQSIEDGDYKTAGRQFAYKLVETLPTTLGILVGSLGGYGTAAAALGAATSGAQANVEGLESGVGPVAQSLNTISNAGFEYLGEKIFTVLPIEAITKKYGKGVANAVFKEAALTFAKQGASEAVGEGLTQLGQSTSGYLTGVSPDAMNTLLQDVLVASGLGGVSGAGFSAPGAIATGLNSVDRQVSRERQAKNTVDTYTEIGDAAKESKLRQRSPQKLENYVETQVKDTNNANIHISPEDFNTYFQKKDEEPLDTLRKLDAIEAYDTAVETGTKIVIPTSKWTARLSEEDYKGLKDDVSYDPRHESVNEVGRLSEEIKVESESAQAEPIIPEDENINEVKRLFKEELMQAGIGETEAEAKSVFEADYFTQRAATNAQGLNALELYNKRNLEMRRADKPIEGSNVYNQDATTAPMFFSKLENTIESKMGNSATVEQVRGIVRDLKPEELEFSNIDEFLSGKEKVSKAELLDFIRENQVQINEVVKGVPVEPAKSKYFDEIKNEIKELLPEDWLGFDSPLQAVDSLWREGPDQFPDLKESDPKLYEKAEILHENYLDLKAQSASKPKFSQYQLPGGENYREVLLTLPIDYFRSAEDLPDGYSVVETKSVTGVEPRDPNDKYAVKGPDGRIGGLASTPEEALKEFQRINLKYGKGIQPGDAYRDPHFGELNTIVHFRLNDRVDSNGKKVLFVEEIQSDWHQEGRKKGYKNSKNKSVPLTEDEKSNLNELDAIVKSGHASMDQVQRHGQLQDRWISESSGGKVPNAPFKKTWQELALKKIIREAVEKGYDKIAWTPGIVQFDRYGSQEIAWVKSGKSWKVNASEQVEGSAAGVNIEQAARARGILKESKGMVVKTKEDLYAAVKDILSRDSNEAQINKLTDRVWDRMQTEPAGTSLPRKEGMEGFYDKILVDAANKLTKKFGGKVEDTLIDGRENLTIKESKGKFQVHDANSSPSLIKTFDTKEAADKFANNYKVHSLEITPALRQSALKDGFSLFQKDDTTPKGQIVLSPMQKIMLLFKDADLSTTLHEGAHVYLDEIKDDAKALQEKDPSTLTAAQSQFLDRSKKVLEFLGVESFDQLTEKEHELFARTFEEYLKEGKAPSKALKEVFQLFKYFLTKIYKSFKSVPGSQINPEISAVFDRLIASEEAIAEMQDQQFQTPIFTTQEASGMNDADWAKYQEAQLEAKQFAEETITNEVMEDLRKLQREEYKEKKSKINGQIEAAVSSQPVYRAIADLKEGKLKDGSQFSINKKDAEIIYGKEFVRSLPRGIVTNDGIFTAGEVATAYGFQNGKMFLDAILAAPKLETAVEMATEAEMQALYPDLFKSPEFSEEAMKAVHNDARARMLRMELEHMAQMNLPVLKDVMRRITRRVPSEKVVKEQAESIISKQNIREIRPYVYQLAERKAAKEAGQLLAKGDFNGAFEAKRKELLNHELYRASQAANEQIKKGLKSFKKFNKKDADLGKVRDVDLVNAGRALLADYGLSRDDKRAEDYLQSMKQYDPEQYETIKSLIESVSARPQDYNGLKYGEFVELKDTLDALWSLSKSTFQIEIDGKKMERAEILEELSYKLSQFKGSDGTPPGYEKAATRWEKTKMGLLSMKAALKRTESWVDAMDLGDIKGAFRKYIFTPVSEATNKYRSERYKYVKKFIGLMEPIRESLKSRDPIVANELNYTFTNKAELLGAMLHIGNDSNKSKLILGRGWGVLNSDGSLDSSKWDAFVSRMQKDGTLTKADYDFLQSVWSLFEELKPAAQKAHKEMYGHYFNEITANEIDTPFGVYKGGYAPAVADPFVSKDARVREEKEILEKFNNSFMFPTSGRGFTKSRVDNYATPLMMDLNLVAGHLDKVLRFTHIEPAVKSVGRILWNKEFRSQIDKFDPAVVTDMLIPWLQRAAQQRVMTPSTSPAGKALDNFFRELRTRTGFTALGLNITNAFQQFTGLSIAAIKVAPKYLRNATWEYSKNSKNSSEEVAEKSQFMENEMKNSIYEAQERIDKLLLNPNAYETVADFAKQNAFILQKLTQNHVSTITWMGAYDQAISENMSEKEAVRAADSAVRLTQGAFNAEDISRFESGSAFVRLFTMFSSYFNMQANLLLSQAFQIRAQELGLKKGAGKALYLYTMGFMIPAFIGDLIVRSLSGKFDEDDDDFYLDDVFESFWYGQVRAVTALVPGVGPLAMATINRVATKSQFDDRLSTSPAISTIENAVAAPMEVYKAIAGKGKSSKAIKDSLTLLTLLTGVPVAPLGRPLGYLADVAEGKAKPSGPFDYVRGLATGKPGSK